jgi:hypothetical protein
MDCGRSLLVCRSVAVLRSDGRVGELERIGGGQFKVPPSSLHSGGMPQDDDFGAVCSGLVFGGKPKPIISLR